MLGWRAGGWIGTKAGFIFGGFGGVIPGGLIGGGVGAAYFSAAVYFDWNQTTPPNFEDTSLFLADENGNYGKFEDLGILHNKIMLDIQNNKASYFHENGQLDSLKLYNRVVEIFTNNGYRTDTLDVNHSKAMIACSQKYCVKLKEEGVKLTDIERTFTDFTTDFQLDEEKRTILNLNYLVKLNSMPKADLQNYSKEYYAIILNSDIKLTLKDDILRSNSIITNSTLCWKKN